MKALAVKIVTAAIDEVNADQEPSEQVLNDSSATLLGDGSALDSLALVRLLLAVERIFEEQTGRSCVVVDESTFDEEQSPFATVGSLTLHVERLLG